MGINIYDRPDRKKQFGVKWVVDGRRKFKFFATKRERDGFIKDFQKREAVEGSAILKFSAADASILAECVKKAGSALDVLRIVDAAQGSKRTGPALSLADAGKMYVNEKINAGRNEAYTSHIDDVLLKFVWRKAMPHQVTVEDALAWVVSLQLKPVTVNNHIKIMRTFYNWLIAHGYAVKNVFKLVPLIEVAEAEPEFLSVEESHRLLLTAKERWPDAVAYFALGLFAGLRASAVVGLDPDCIRWEQRGILIRGDNAKNKRRQFVDGHEPVLWEWLEWAKANAPEGFTLSKRMWERRRTQVREAAVVEMPKNALRHTFCTFHVALLGDANRTATLLTHRGNVSILYDHYKGNATRPDAEEFFGLLL